MSTPPRALAVLRGILRLVGVVAVFCIGIALGTLASAQMDDGGGCVYDRRVYPEGAEMCQGSERVQCNEGAWEDVGDCDVEQPGPEPISEGGDMEMD
jgi:hypothetical protein